MIICAKCIHTKVCEWFPNIDEYCTDYLEKKPRGNWIDVPVERDLIFNKGIKYTCSACGTFNSYGHSKYCPNCGAYMKGGAE